MSSFWLDYMLQMTYTRFMNLLTTKNSSTSTATLADDASTAAASGQSAASRPFSEIIQEASEKYGVDEKVIRAVIQAESSFNAKAVSRAGAGGLMQLMPRTARSLGVSDVFDAEQNIMAGVKYLKQKLDEFDGDLKLALAAYNAGSGAVRKYGGIPPYQETVRYVEKIMKKIDYRA